MKKRAAAFLMAAAVAMSLPAACAAESAGTEESSTEAEADLSQYESEIESSVDLQALEKAKDDSGIAAEDWLPIGSVVLLKGANKSLMVMSRFVYNTQSGLYYDYCGCLYPEGFGESDYYFFNQDQIEVVAQKGYEDEYEKLYREKVLDRLDVAVLNELSAASETETEGQ